ncbi:hypothetical protein SAMN05444158_6098 [Bradyrhizobium canariense]|uniref:Uncharacterized protein n=1 Tax=Bradyrhizobium canariense TaxID=255045 RepID=A0A1H2AFQ9_9BRAD|nr:hypothetical protein SAMN05444158_6098 [Bradyrhizobium canariense]
MRDANAQRGDTMIPIRTMRQASEPHVSHAETGGLCSGDLGRPALRLADHEVAEHLHARNCLQFFGINKISIELN